MPAAGQIHPQLGGAPPETFDSLDPRDAALEVIVLWGEHDALHVAQASPPRSFCVGDAARADGTPDTDYVIGSEVIGSERLPITVQSETGTALVIPRGAHVELIEGARHASLEELFAAGRLAPYPELDGALQCALPPGATARLSYAGFSFVVTLSRAPSRAGLGLGAAAAIDVDREALPATMSSVALHLGALLLFYFQPPTSSALALAEIDAEHRAVDYVLAAYELPEPEPILDKTGDDEPSGRGGQPAQGDPGTSGDEKSPKTDGKRAVAGPKDNPHPEIPREEQKRSAETAGIIGALHAAAAWTNPSSIFGRERALGADPESALGALLGDRIGANRGFGGLTAYGTGRGGGGPAIGTLGTNGLNTIGNIGRDGEGPGGYGKNVGLRGREPRIVPPIRPGTPEIKGALSKETIRRIVHRHLNEIRHCYEEGMRTRPDLQGRVAVQFVVAPSGEVKVAMRASSTLGDARVEQCIVGAVKRWTFPAPDGGGVVMVTYPFVLQHTGS